MPNADELNRTIFISDNLPFLQALDTESVDLVVIDPPFGKKRAFEGAIRPPLTAQETERERERMAAWGVYDVASAYELGLEYPDQSGDTAIFEDIWRFELVVREDWWADIYDTPVWWLIESTRRAQGDDTAAYIAFMAQRMMEIRRILRPAGSVYLHCDHEANAYLRQMMDVVFGRDNFRNEIVWRRQNANNSVRTRFGHITDTILFYARTRAATWNQPYAERSETESKRFRRDAEGRLFKAQDLTAPTPNPSRMFNWRGTTPRNGWRYSLERLEELWAEGRILTTRDGRPRTDGRIEYLDELPKGAKMQNLWTDISRVANTSRERSGYPTQKPQALARRMIEASSNPGDLVLDCFAGCAYVPVAAEETGRRWIACDMSPRAFTVIRRQFAKKPELGMTVEGEEAEYEAAEPRFEGKGVLRIRGPNQMPSRADGGTNGERLPPRSQPPKIRFRQKPLESGDEIWRAFVDHWGADCWYCGRPRDKERSDLHLDHIEPNKGDGSNDDCWNRALACPSCNRTKGYNLTPAETMDKALEAGHIQTAARRDEIGAAFSVRREWARERYESLPKDGNPPELSATPLTDEAE